MDTERPASKLAFSIAEAVKATSVGRTRLYEEIAAGRLPTFKIGKRTLIATEDLRAWLDSHKPKKA